MPEYRFSLTGIFPFKERISDYILIQEDMAQRKPVFWNILLSENLRLRNAPEQLALNENIEVSLHFSDYSNSFPY